MRAPALTCHACEPQSSTYCEIIEKARNSRAECTEECASLVEGHRGEILSARVQGMEAQELRPHFHVWEPLTFAGFLAALDLPFSLELLQTSMGEFVAVLRRR